MNELTPEDYVEILNGGWRGAHFSQNYYIVSRKEEKNPIQILLKEGMGLPLNINDEYEEVKNPKKKKEKETKQLMLTFYVI